MPGEAVAWMFTAEVLIQDPEGDRELAIETLKEMLDRHYPQYQFRVRAR